MNPNDEIDAQELHNQILRTHWNSRVDREVTREADHPAKRVHTDLLWREINRAIRNTQELRILDAGAGAGRFSTLLAAEGHHVTHLDISTAMLGAAQSQAAQRGISEIEFLEGDVSDLSRFANGSFDLVLCLDSPLSFCGNRCGIAVSELVRVTSEALILCVINALGVIAEGGINFDLEHFGRLQTTHQVFVTGRLDVTEEILQYVPTLMPTWKAFRPIELQALIEAHECEVVRTSAPGTLARFVKPELLTKLFEDDQAYADFLDFEERFDADESVRGIGGMKAGGLLLTALKRMPQST